MDVFAVHGVGGIVGNILTGFCTQRYWSALDGKTILYSGVIEGEGLLLAWQVVACLATFSWSFIVTSIILLGLNQIPGLSLRLHSDHEEAGIDISEIGEVSFDYLNKSSSLKRRNMEMKAGKTDDPINIE